MKKWRIKVISMFSGILAIPMVQRESVGVKSMTSGGWMLSFSVPNIFLLNGYSLFPVRFNKFMVDMLILTAILLMLK